MHLQANEPINLTSQELLVFQYLKDRCQGGESICEPHGDIAKHILENYSEGVRVTKKRIRKGENPEQFNYADKQFSATTVSRAISKLSNQGFISIISSKDKSKPNEIFWMEQHSFEDSIALFDQDQKRFQSRMNQMIQMIQTEYESIQSIKQELSYYKEKYDVLKTNLQQCIIFKKDDLISSEIDDAKGVGTVQFRLHDSKSKTRV